jgi:hypothetical protein
MNFNSSVNDHKMYDEFLNIDEAKEEPPRFWNKLFLDDPLYVLLSLSQESEYESLDYSSFVVVNKIRFAKMDYSSFVVVNKIRFAKKLETCQRNHIITEEKHNNGGET